MTERESLFPNVRKEWEIEIEYTSNGRITAQQSQSLKMWKRHSSTNHKPRHSGSFQGVFKTPRLLMDKDDHIFSVSRIAAKIKLQANQLFSIGWCSSMWSQRVKKNPKKLSLLLLFNRTLEVARTALVGLPHDRFNLLNFFWNGVLESKYDP